MIRSFFRRLFKPRPVYRKGTWNGFHARQHIKTGAVEIYDRALNANSWISVHSCHDDFLAAGARPTTAKEWNEHLRSLRL